MDQEDREQLENGSEPQDGRPQKEDSESPGRSLVTVTENVRELSPEETEAIQHHSEVLDLEADFTETAPTYISEADKILKRVESGELTISDALRQPSAPIRTLIQKFNDKYGLSQDEMRSLRRAHIGKSLIAPESTQEVHHAIVLSQKEDEIATRQGEGRLSKSLQELVEKTMDDKRAKKARKKSKKKDIVTEIKKESENED